MTAPSPPPGRFPDPLQGGFYIVALLVAFLVVQGGITHKPDMTLLTPLLTALGSLGALLAKRSKKDGDSE